MGWQWAQLLFKKTRSSLKSRVRGTVFLQLYMFWFNLCLQLPLPLAFLYYSFYLSLQESHSNNALHFLSPVWHAVQKTHKYCLASWAQSGIRKKYFWLSTNLSVFLLQTVSGELASVSFKISLAPEKSKVTWKEQEKPEMLNFSTYFYSDLDLYFPRLFY